MVLMNKTLKYKEFIKESVIHGIDEDVEYIYSFFKKDIEEIEKTGIVTEDMFKYHIINTGDLKSDTSKKCHDLNPCEIHINHDLKTSNNINLTNFYAPQGTLHFTEDSSVIAVKIHDQLLYLLDEYSGDLKFIVSLHGEEIKSELKSYKLKATIRHELAHWINDTLNNRYISKFLRNKTMGKILKKHKAKRPASIPFEIYAIIQNIFELKREFKDEWDDLTFDEMVDKLPALISIRSNLNPEEYNRWKRKVKTKMWKDNLLGKNMK